MSERMVNCVKLGKEAPGLAVPPFEGELGEEIFEKVSLEAWNAWQEDFQIKVINEYRLNLAEPEHYDVLLQQMRAFLNLDSSAGVLEVENAERGKSS